MGESWIGVDLDGTLAHYHGWVGIDHIGDPVYSMFLKVQKWLDEGKKVKIFSARVEHGEDAVRKIHDWCERHGLPKLEVTNRKDMHCVELWDDRAIQVMANLGLSLYEYITYIEPPERMKPGLLEE